MSLREFAPDPRRTYTWWRGAWWTESAGQWWTYAEVQSECAVTWYGRLCNNLQQVWHPRAGGWVVLVAQRPYPPGNGPGRRTTLHRRRVAHHALRSQEKHKQHARIRGPCEVRTNCGASSKSSCRRSARPDE